MVGDTERCPAAAAAADPISRPAPNIIDQACTPNPFVETPTCPYVPVSRSLTALDDIADETLRCVTSSCDT